MDRSNVQLRELQFDIAERGNVDDGIPVVVSSDDVVDVSDGPEILVHSEESVDLKRAPLPIIATHDNRQVNVGLVGDLRIDGGLLRGMARFGKRPEAAGYREDVLGGIIRSVSVGYARIKARIRTDGVLVTQRWMPTHVAMVAEPADIRAGFYRGRAKLPAFEIEQEVAEQSDRSVCQPAATAASVGVTQMSDTKAAVAGEQTAANPVVVESTPRISPAEAEAKRKQAIVNLCRANKVDERIERQWIESGADMNEVSEGIVAVLAERSKSNPVSAAKIDMSTAEVRRYSLMRAIRAAMSRDWTHAGLELEAHKAVMKRTNGQPRTQTSFYIPLDIQQRDMTAAGVSGSNYLVSTDNLAGSFIDMLRNRSVTMTLGVTRLSGLQGNITIPRETAGATAYWLADETTAITESQPTIGQLSLSPKNVAALTEVTHQLLQQSSPNVEEFVMRVLAKDVALAVDIGIMRGSGNSGQPQGIVGTSGVGSFTVDGTDTIGDLLNAQADVAGANALTASCAYVTTPAVAAILRARTEFSSTDTPLWRGNILDGQVLGFRAMSSNQMASGTMLFGDWQQALLAEWGVLEISVNPFSDFTRGYQQIRAWYTCDVGVRQPGAFSYASSAA